MTVSYHILLAFDEDPGFCYGSCGLCFVFSRSVGSFCLSFVPFHPFLVSQKDPLGSSFFFFSMFKRPDQRVAIFIDTQNMYHSAKHLYSAKVNFPALVAAAVGDRRVIRAVAYVAKSKTGEEQAFFEALTQNGIELKVKDVQEFASGQKKADWDVGMAVDAISIAAKVDVVILVTGDGDFVPLVEYLHGHGTLCEIVAFGASTNAQLRASTTSFLDLSDDPDLFLIRPRRRTQGNSPQKGSGHEHSAQENALDEIDGKGEEDDTDPFFFEPSAPPKQKPPLAPPSEKPHRQIRITY